MPILNKNMNPSQQTYSMWKDWRKFGLTHCDLPTMIWNISTMMRVLTLNIDSRNKKSIPLTFYIITLVVAAAYFYVYLISMVWFVFWRCQETGDLIAGMIVLSLGITSEMSTTKLMFMMIYRKKVREIVDLYMQCDSHVKPNSRFSRTMMASLRHVKKRAMIFWAVIIGNGVVYIIKPLVTPGRHLMEDLFTLFGLDPSKESPNYEISFVLMTLGVVFTCYLPANITAFLIIIIGYTEAQMLALSEEIVNIWHDALRHQGERTLTHISDSNDEQTTSQERAELTTRNNVFINEYVKLRLREIIKIHTTNLRLLHEVEQIFRGAIAFEFAILIVGLIVELLGRLENTYLEVPYALMQVAMDCLTGQRLMDASLIFENSVYACNWENFDVKNMKTVLLMLQISQKNMKLTAGGVTILSFSSLMLVIRSIYSAYTALRSTMT